MSPSMKRKNYLGLMMQVMLTAPLSQSYHKQCMNQWDKAMPVCHRTQLEHGCFIIYSRILGGQEKRLGENMLNHIKREYTH